MIHDIFRHKLDYFLLAIFSLVYVVFFLWNQLNSQLLFISTLAFGGVYFLWGIYHHLHTHTFAGKVVLEYLLVSIFAVLLVSTLLI